MQLGMLNTSYAAWSTEGSTPTLTPGMLMPQAVEHGFSREAPTEAAAGYAALHGREECMWLDNCKNSVRSFLLGFRQLVVLCMLSLVPYISAAPRTSYSLSSTAKTQCISSVAKADVLLACLDANGQAGPSPCNLQILVCSAPASTGKEQPWRWAV